MPDDELSKSGHGPSTTQMNDAEEAPKVETVRKGVEDVGQQDDRVDLEKGIKPVGNGDLEGSDAGQMINGHGYQEEDTDDEGRCRVCHLVFDSGLGMNETMQLGCHCKEDLAIAHRDCAEAWFKIKGNRVCEICGATAQNIVGADDSGFMEQWNDATAANSAEPQARCWQSLSLCNFFLACMVVTFILLWLFRVTIN